MNTRRGVFAWGDSGDARWGMRGVAIRGHQDCDKIWWRDDEIYVFETFNNKAIEEREG